MAGSWQSKQERKTGKKEEISKMLFYIDRALPLGFSGNIYFLLVSEVSTLDDFDRSKVNRNPGG